MNPAPLTITADSMTKTYGQTETLAGTDVHDERAGQQRHGVQRDPEQHGRGGDAAVAGSPYAIIASGAVGSGLTQLHDHLRQRQPDGQPGAA